MNGMKHPHHCPFYWKYYLNQCHGLEINGKSIMGVLMLAAAQGSIITVRAEGDDAQPALDALRILVENRFGEEE